MQPMNEMTREQAISKLQEEFDLLKGDTDIDGLYWPRDLGQVLKMGIEALRAADIEPDDLYLIELEACRMAGIDGWKPLRKGE